MINSYWLAMIHKKTTFRLWGTVNDSGSQARRRYEFSMFTELLLWVWNHPHPLASFCQWIFSTSPLVIFFFFFQSYICLSHDALLSLALFPQTTRRPPSGTRQSKSICEVLRLGNVTLNKTRYPIYFVLSYRISVPINKDNRIDEEFLSFLELSNHVEWTIEYLFIYTFKSDFFDFH